MRGKNQNKKNVFTKGIFTVAHLATTSHTYWSLHISGQRLPSSGQKSRENIIKKKMLHVFA